MKKQISTLFLFLFTTLFSVLTLTAQDKQVVSGTVIDAKTGEAMIGVSVSIAGTGEGAVTNIDGKYELSLTSLNVTLKFSYLGYTTMDIPLNGRQVLNVSMKESSQMIEEVVVVGYGQQKKQSVIASIASIDNSTLVSSPVSNVTQALAGKLPGIQIVQSSGEVGRDEAEIWVRGQGTWNNSTPLYIVDGVVRESIAQIDPNEIQSFNLLKDASATAVYGVRGANGVIIITTRRGVIGAPKVSFTAKTAVTEPIRIPYPLNAYQASSLKNLHKYAANGSDDYSALDIILYRTHASPYTHPDVSWLDEIMKDYSSMQQYNLNITGGTNFLKYFVSGGLTTQNGYYKYDDNTNFTRYNFRSNLDFSLSKQFTLAFNLGARVEKRIYPAISTDNSWEVYRAAFATTGRTFPVFNPDGSLGGNSTYTSSNLIGRLRDKGHIRDTNAVVETSLDAKYKMDFITKGLLARAQLAFDNGGRNRTRWDKNFATYYYDLRNDTYSMNGENTYLAGNLSDRQFRQNLYIEMGLEYARSFNKHSVSGLFLATRNDRLNDLNIGYAAQGLIGRATYDFDKRYFAEVNIGYNGSENFARGKRYGLFPAFSLGWLISNESFIQDTSISDILSTLKLRASLGWVGNDRYSNNQNDRFSYIQRYDYGGGASFGIGDTWYNGIRMGNIANYDLTWEVARKLNIGFDSNFWNQKISLTVDYFNEYRTNLLTGIGNIIPVYVGSGFMPANVGIATNRGIEFDASYRNKIGKDFSYSIKGNYSFTRNKVIKKADPIGSLPYQKEEGYPIGTPLMYKYIGIFQSYEEIYSSPNQMPYPGVTEVLPGDLKYLDFNNDGMIDLADAFRQGYGTTPEIQYGATLGFEYKNLDFNVLFQGSAHALFKKNWEIMYHFSNNDNVFARHWYAWTPEIDGYEQYMRIYGSYWQNERPEAPSTYVYGSGDYLRIKSMELGYTLPRKLTKKASMSSVRIYLSGTNLITWSTEPYLDPDNRDQRGGLMPPTRAFNVGLNVNF